MLYTEIHNLLFGDSPGLLAGVDQVQLVGYDYFWHFVLDLLLDLSEPHLEVLEAFPLGDVKHNDGSMALAVVGTSDGHILFSSCCLSPAVHVSQMLTRISLEPTRRLTGAYSTPMVGVRFFSLAFLPMI